MYVCNIYCIYIYLLELEKECTYVCMYVCMNECMYYVCMNVCMYLYKNLLCMYGMSDSCAAFLLNHLQQFSHLRIAQAKHIVSELHLLLHGGNAAGILLAFF
jgi:hypothetical protein